LGVFASEYQNLQFIYYIWSSNGTILYLTIIHLLNQLRLIKIIKTEMHFASRTDINTPIERTRQCFEFIAEFLPTFFRVSVPEVVESDEEGQKKDKYDELSEKMASYDWSAEHKAAFADFIPGILKFTTRQKLGSSKTMEIKAIDGVGLANYLMD
jgi:hypothetical protein